MLPKDGVELEINTYPELEHEYEQDTWGEIGHVSKLGSACSNTEPDVSGIGFRTSLDQLNQIMAQSLRHTPQCEPLPLTLLIAGLYCTEVCPTQAPNPCIDWNHNKKFKLQRVE